jgi:hypothetical protein
MAFGTFRRGFSASPAARATISVPRKENAALRKVAQNARKRPLLPGMPLS